MTKVEKSILQTLVWFDIFDYPLTLREIHKWLWWPLDKPAPTLVEILKILQSDRRSLSQISTDGGFYFLAGRQAIVRERLKRYRLAEKKFQRAKRIAKLLSIIPFIKFIAVCNNLGYANALISSDIDFFIITAGKRIWLTRFLSISLMKILGLRPKLRRFGEAIEERQDRADLSFFISEDNLNLSSVSLPSRKNPLTSSAAPAVHRELPDIYLAYWLTWLTPLYERNNIYQRFWQANSWLKHYLPNSQPYLTTQRRRLKENLSYLKDFIVWCHSFAFNGASEKFYRWLQLKVMPTRLKTAVGQSSGVVIADNILKFHDNDRREFYRQLFLEKCLALGVNY